VGKVGKLGKVEKVGKVGKVWFKYTGPIMVQHGPE
jgi:hypothetical protein